MSEITFEDVRRLTLEPGDALMLKLGHDVDQEELAVISDQAQAMFPDHPVVVLVDCDLAIVSAPAPWDSVRELAHEVGWRPAFEGA